jgi:SOS-response transcriptional repressor LexA
MQLTSLQRELLDFIRYHHERFGFGPSTKRIELHFGFPSPDSVDAELKALESVRLIELPRGPLETIRLRDAAVRDNPVEPSPRILAPVSGG